MAGKKRSVRDRLTSGFRSTPLADMMNLKSGVLKSIQTALRNIHGQFTRQMFILSHKTQREPIVKSLSRQYVNSWVIESLTEAETSPSQSETRWSTFLSSL